jgi:hypothetical protein
MEKLINSATCCSVNDANFVFWQVCTLHSNSYNFEHHNQS